MSNQENRPHTHCLNCGTELNGDYCHNCGQQDTDPNSIKDMIMVYLDNAFMWDPKILRTIWQLVRRPGYLTTAFTSGKVASYIHPLKLNMFLLFVFLTMFFCFSGSNKMHDSMHNITSDAEVYPRLQLQFLADNAEFAERLKTSSVDTIQISAPQLLATEFPQFINRVSAIDTPQSQQGEAWTAAVASVLIEDEIIVPDREGCYHFNTKEESQTEELEFFHSIWDELSDIVTGYFPMIVLLTVPFLALSLRLVHRKSCRPNAHHFVFALHYISFLELIILIIYTIHLLFSPSIKLLEWVINICSCIYLTIAFRQVYDIRSWVKAGVKALLTSALYMFICLSFFVCIFFAAIIIASVQLA